MVLFNAKRSNMSNWTIVKLVSPEALQVPFWLEETDLGRLFEI
jgi:hypothetical protein